MRIEVQTQATMRLIDVKARELVGLRCYIFAEFRFGFIAAIPQRNFTVVSRQSGQMKGRKLTFRMQGRLCSSIGANEAFDPPDFDESHNDP